MKNLLETSADKHIVRFIMEMLSNRSFWLHISNGQSSSVRKLKNGVPQGSVLAPMLFNIYIHDLPATQSSKYDCADDLAIFLSKLSWESLEKGLSEDLNILSSYLKNWHLKLSGDRLYHQCSTSTTNKHRATPEYQPFPTHLCVKLYRTLSFRQHPDTAKARATPTNCPSLEKSLLQRSGKKEPGCRSLERHRRVSPNSSTKL